MPKTVTQLDIQNHINREYRQVHQGSWAQIKAYIDDRYTVVEEDKIDDEMTLDATWRTFSCALRTGYAGQPFVILSIEVEMTGAEQTQYIELNRYNVVANWRNRVAAGGAIETVVPADATIYNSSEIKMPLDSSGRFNYKANNNGTLICYIVGYER